MSEKSQSWLKRLLGKSGSDTSEVSEMSDHDHTGCIEVRDSASDFVDGEMSATLSDRIKQHLGICGDCDSWVKSFATTVGIIKEIPPEKPPESLMAKIKNIPGSHN